VQPKPEPVVENLSDVLLDEGENIIDEPIEIEGSFGGQAVGVRVNRDGSLEMTRPEDEQIDAPPPERDRRRREPGSPDEGF